MFGSSEASYLNVSMTGSPSIIPCRLQSCVYERGGVECRVLLMNSGSCIEEREFVSCGECDSSWWCMECENACYV